MRFVDDGPRDVHPAPPLPPPQKGYEETLSTLRYADTAKKIQTFAVVNEDANAKMVRELREEVLRLRAMLSNSGIDGMSVVSDSQMVDLKDRLGQSKEGNLPTEILLEDTDGLTQSISALSMR